MGKYLDSGPSTKLRTCLRRNDGFFPRFPRPFRWERTRVRAGVRRMIRGESMSNDHNCVKFIFFVFLSFFLPSNLLALEVGDKAPDFELPSTQGGKLKLSSFRGNKNVLIEFYVLDFTAT